MQIRSHGMFTAYSGASIKPYISVPGKGAVPIGEIQTITYSVHTETRPGRVLGSRRARGFARGGRTVAGTIIFTVIDKHIVRKLAPQVGNVTLFDEMPPIDITVSFSSEDGRTARLGILGVRVVDEGQIMAIDDLIIENTVSYIAEDIVPLDDSEIEMVVERPEPMPKWVVTPPPPSPPIQSSLKVTALAGGEPAQGVKVELYDTAGNLVEGVRGLTDAKGQTELVLPFEGTFDVVGYCGGKVERRTGVYLQHGVLASVTLSFPAGVNTAVISGRVWSALKRAWLPDAEVVVKISGKYYTAKTDPEGAYRITVPFGSFTRLEIYAAGHGSYLGKPPCGVVDIVGDKELENVPLYPIGPRVVLSGKVLCAMGEPIAGASVVLRLSSGTTIEVVASSEGSWEVTGPFSSPLSFPIVSITYSAHMHESWTVSYGAGLVVKETRSVGTIRLIPKRPEVPEIWSDPDVARKSGVGFKSCSGYVTTSSGKPIPHCIITCTQLIDGQSWVRYAETDEQGRYRLEYLLEVPAETIVFSAVGYQELRLSGESALPIQQQLLNVSLVSV